MPGEVTSVAQLFDQRLPEFLKTGADQAAAVDGVFLFQVSGADGGTWTLNFCAADAGPWVRPGAHGTPGCTLDISAADLLRMLRLLKGGNAQIGTQLFIQGKLKINGNPGLAMKLAPLLAQA